MSHVNEDRKSSYKFHYFFNFDPTAIINDDNADGGMANGRSMDSLRSSYTNSSSSSELDTDISPDDKEEKARLISQVLELQNTLDGSFRKLYLQVYVLNVAYSRSSSKSGQC